MKIYKITSALVGICIVALPALADAPATAKKPNVIFIMSDQHSAHALGCYGNSEVSTPNLDKLASEGVRFENAIVQTGQCVPNRFAIFTGRYPRTTGTYGNGNGQDPKEQTVADLFDQAGYVTATIGKHHMEMNSVNHDHGFKLVSNPVGNAKPHAPLPYAEVHPGRSEVGESPLPNEKHTDGLVTSQAIQFIEKNKDKPFVLWCSYLAPHTPITPSAPWSRQYDPKKLTLPPNHLFVDRQMPGMSGLLSKSGKYSEDFYHNQTLAFYYGCVSQNDYNIGVLLAELDKLGLTDNTIIIYSADHGEMMSEHGAWTKGETGYDATIRVPMIIKYGKTFSGGKVVKDLVCSIDILPTLLDVCGLNIPINIQGKSMVALMKDNSGWRQYAFSELGNSVDNTVIAVRSQAEKYVLFRKVGKPEYEQFFDLKTDPWETNNLVANVKYETDLANLKSVLKDWEANTEVAPPVKLSGKAVDE